MIDERGTDMEAQVLEIIQDMLAADPSARLSVKDITDRFIERHGADYEKKITTRWIGSVIRRRLNAKTQKTRGVFVIPTSETAKLGRLYEKYGIALDTQSPGDVSPHPVRAENDLTSMP
jgi:hypothetical protein